MADQLVYPGLGAIPHAGGVRFTLYAPAAERVEVILEDDNLENEHKAVPMRRSRPGYFEAFIEGLEAGAHYRLKLDGQNPLPDPASRFQPGGVHGPSEVVDPNIFVWRDDGWQGVPHKELVFYELHVGTFTPAGTYAGVKDKLPYLKELGITAVELMPLADFPGRWNWGYDPAAFFAPSRAYGTPDELRSLVDEAHQMGLAVYLDVVYNHMGPDGAYLPAFVPHLFTDKHHSPWGEAINLDGEGSEGVRRFFLENALHWLTEYHFDGLRLDATFALVDNSSTHFLAELAAAAQSVPGWRRLLVAEDPRNLRMLVEPRAEGGYGLDAIWADDFHHIIRRALAGDEYGYYRDFAGTTDELVTTLRQGWLYIGQFSSNEGQERGTPTGGLTPETFVLCIQNHDQIGNRPEGNRLTDDISLPAYRAATAALLFAPELPLLFMGQEWAANTPFQYFTDHHLELGKLVSEGRKKEFKDFPDFAGEDVPDPQAPQTFERSKLDWAELNRPEHTKTLQLYQDLLALRRQLEGAFSAQSPTEGGLVLRRGRHMLLIALQEDVYLPLDAPAQERWRSEDAAYAEKPVPPEVSGGGVHFSVPGALLLEVTR